MPPFRIPGPRAAACVFLALPVMAAGCDRSDPGYAEPPPPDPPRGTPVPFTRIPVWQMELENGVMVIRRDEEWRALWKRYAPT